MENLDLNLEHYELNDILELFGLSCLFDKSDLRDAKKIVLRTHPDKSKLPKEYFLFFLSAFRVLNDIYNFKIKTGPGSENGKNIDYPINTTYTIETNKEQQLILNKFKDKTSEFNKEFNNFFESNRIENPEYDTGYGDWLQSNNDIDKISSDKNMEQIFIEKKEKMRKHELAIKKDVSEYTQNGDGSNLANDIPEEYSSDVFSKLRYDDIKRAHTETVVPVTYEDYLQHQKFNSVNEIKQYRQTQDTTPLSVIQSKQYLADKQNTESTISTQRAFSLYKQSEEATKINKKWWGKLQQLTYS